MSTSDYLKQAIEEVQQLNGGEIFLVKDLFKGYIWNRINKSERLRLGMLFINEIQSNKTIEVEVLNKTTSNQQKYKKRP